jgi:hypothetical protein
VRVRLSTAELLFLGVAGAIAFWGLLGLVVK